ncbi:MAG: hypothetical protein GY696_28175 [Gammaproteobacteria bacterium]|nr:hypothetical protein [Gammaproteobacteria bacterium]
MTDLLTYAENAGMDNLRFRLQNADALAKDAVTTLTVILAGMAGSLAFTVQRLGNEELTPLTIGAATLAIWLMITGCLLVLKCMQTSELQAPTNEPNHLFQPDFETEAIRKVELCNIQERIDLTKARNNDTAYWLDRCRLLALSSPVIFIIVVCAGMVL